MTLQSSSLRPYQQKLENARKRKEESEKQQPPTGFRSVILRDETYIRYMHYGRPGNSFDEIASKVLDALEGKYRKSSILLTDACELRARGILS